MPDRVFSMDSRIAGLGSGFFRAIERFFASGMSRALSFELWALSLELWALSFELWALSFELWALSFDDSLTSFQDLILDYLPMLWDSSKIHPRFFQDSPDWLWTGSKMNADGCRRSDVALDSFTILCDSLEVARGCSSFFQAALKSCPDSPRFSEILSRSLTVASRCSTFLDSQSY